MLVKESPDCKNTASRIELLFRIQICSPDADLSADRVSRNHTAFQGVRSAQKTCCLIHPPLENEVSDHGAPHFNPVNLNISQNIHFKTALLAKIFKQISSTCSSFPESVIGTNKD